MKRSTISFKTGLENQIKNSKSGLFELKYLKHLGVDWAFTAEQAEAIEKRWGGENKVWGILIDRISDFKKDYDGKCERLSRMLITNLKQQGFSLKDIMQKTALSLEEVEHYYFED
ncbi:hypothetical protein ACYSNX_11595 [Myroides sp. LJL115]